MNVNEDGVTNNNESGKKLDNEKTTSLFLCFVNTIVNLHVITLGATTVWISPMASKLASSDPDENPLGRPISTFELSLVGSLSQAGMVIGPLLLEKFFDRFGRKRSVNILMALVVCCYAILSLSQHIYLYYAAIFSIGILLGGCLVGIFMYISEVTEDHNRGSFSCYSGAFIPVGNLYAFILGSCFSAKVFNLLCALPALFAIVISVLFLPESPQYLINISEKKEALKVVRKLLGAHHSRAINLVATVELNTKKINNNKAGVIKELFGNRSSRNGFLICCILTLLPFSSGIPSVMSYLHTIFKEAQIDTFYSTLAVGSLHIFCYLTASILVEKMGRKVLLLLSISATTVPLLILSVYFYLIDIGAPIVDDLKWVPAAGVLLLILTATTGMCTVPLVYLNETFTNDVKSTALSILYFISTTLVTCEIFLFPLVQDLLGLSWCFGAFLVMCIPAFLFVLLTVPETKGRNISEIQEMLAGRKLYSISCK
ncbi:unnamed protein product [Phyllotreta striolata]|uniref:Major facilitator superfamily (MFS) profile domain-containing protein n=1 Tax=Phyllotreta striolata TaxID=444603 RepID=A0A9N9TTM3_PHYSR|nr:unnamed protein product [Phyllotreta striolata]